MHLRRQIIVLVELPNVRILFLFSARGGWRNQFSISNVLYGLLIRAYSQDIIAKGTTYYYFFSSKKLD